MISALFLGALICSPTQARQSDNTLSKSLQPYDWAVQLAWGQASSRWELKGGLEKMHPDSWRVSLIKPRLFTPKVFDVSLQIDIDTSIYHWNDPWLDRHLSVVSVVPIIRKYLQAQNFEYFLGFGIGVAVIDSEIWMDRMLGSRLQFEDKFEAGIRFQRHQISFGLSHFSNADLADINHGVNVYQLSYAVYF